MNALISFFGSGLFFVPFAYIALYLYIERAFDRTSAIQSLMKMFTVVGGGALILGALAVPPESLVLLPSRGGTQHHVQASVFLMIVGAAIMALPVYSRFITFSNRTP